MVDFSCAGLAGGAGCKAVVSGEALQRDPDDKLRRACRPLALAFDRLEAFQETANVDEKAC